MKSLLCPAFSVFLFCSSALGKAKTNWDYHTFHLLNTRVAESINKLTSYESYEKVRQAIKNPKDQDALKTLYIKMKSHPLKTFPLFDRLVISSGMRIHTVKVHSLVPLVLSVDAHPPVEVDLKNVARVFSGKSAVNKRLELVWSSAHAEPTSQTYTATEFLSLYGLVTESFGTPVFEDNELNSNSDRKLKNDAQKIQLAESVATFLNHFKVKQFICSPMNEIEEKLAEKNSTAKFLFLMTTQDSKRFAGSCTDSNACKYFPLMTYPASQVEGRDFLGRKTERALELAIKALQAENVLQKAKPKDFSLTCAAKGLGIGIWHDSNPKDLDDSKIAKQDQCYLNYRELIFGDRAHELVKTLDLPQNELLRLAQTRNNRELTVELQKILSTLRQIPMTTEGYVLPELTKNGAVAALYECCKDSACRKEFTHNGQAVFSDFDSGPEHQDPDPPSESAPVAPPRGRRIHR
jgi:hypothetical protein